MILREIVNLIGYEVDEAAFREVEERSKALFDGIESFGKQMSMKVTAPIMAAAAFAVNNFTEYKTALEIVKQTITSTGGAAGKTSDELDKMSTSLESHSLFAHDKILQDITGTMLTFDKVTGATFDRASQAAIDLAARWKIDLQSAALMVGKALQDPSEGLGMLTRRYVHMTKAEKDHIKALTAAGRTGEAQKYILDAIGRSTGGMAQKIRDASSGFIIFRNKLMEVGTSFGEILQPYFKKFYDMLVKVLDKIEKLSPTTKKAIVIFLGIAATIGPLLVGLGGIGTLGLMAAQGLGAIARVIPAIAGALGVTSIAALGWIALIVVAIVALFLIVEDFMQYIKGGDSIFGKMFAPWKELAPQIIQTIGPVIDWLKFSFESVIQILRGVVQVIAWLLSGNSDMLLKGIQNLIMGVLNLLNGLLNAITEAIIALVPTLLKALLTIFTTVVMWLDNLIETMLEKIKKVPILGNIISGIGSFVNAFNAAGANIPSTPQGFAASMAGAGSSNRSVSVNSTIAMTVPAGTQQQQIQAVQQAAEQAVKFEFYQQTKNAIWQMVP